MKKILCLGLLFCLPYCQTITGNDFLREYPFGKKPHEMKQFEANYVFTILGFIQGYRESNIVTTVMMHNQGIRDGSISAEEMNSILLNDNISFVRRICQMTNDQIIRMVKKWCDNNPEQTHEALSTILMKVILELPLSEDCK